MGCKNTVDMIDGALARSALSAMPSRRAAMRDAEPHDAPRSHDRLARLIGFTIVLASFISGVFGMAGGMVLLGVLLVYFDVATGMVLFSIMQITANGWRALQWRRFVLWPIFYLVCRRRDHSPSR